MDIELLIFFLSGGNIWDRMAFPGFGRGLFRRILKWLEVQIEERNDKKSTQNEDDRPLNGAN